MNPGRCQSGFSLIGEVGVNSGGLPKHDFVRYDGGHAEKNTYPVISPVVGLSLVGRARLRLSAGLQLFGTGQRHHYSSDAINIYLTDMEELMAFTRLLMPLTLGYRINCRNMALIPWIGYRHTYFIAGKYRYTIRSKSKYVTSRPKDEDKSYNPFSAEEVWRPAHRHNGQVTAGASLDFNNRVILSFSYSKGGTVRFQETPDIVHQFSRGDLMLSLAFKLHDF